MSFFKLTDLTSFYFTKLNFNDKGYTINYLSKNGYTITQLYESGYSIYDLSGLYYSGDISGSDLINSIIPASELKKIMNTTTFPLKPIMQYYLSNQTLTTSIQKLFQIYNVIDIYSTSSTILQEQRVPNSNIPNIVLSFKQTNGITVSQIYPIINNTQLFPIISINQLQQSSYTLSNILELIDNNPILYSYSSIYQSLNFKIIDFYNANVSASNMRSIGYINNQNIIQITPRTLYSSGYSLIELYNGGFNSTDFSNSEFTIRDLVNGGLSVLQIRTLYGENISLDDLITKYNASLSQLISGGFKLKDIAPYKITYYSIQNFLLFYTLQELQNVGFLPIDLYNGTIFSGVPSISQLLKLGYDSSFIIPLDIPVIDYYNSGYSSLNLFNNGFNINILSNKYSLLNFKNDAIPIYQIYLSNIYSSSAFITVGYLLSDFYNGRIPIGFIAPYYSLPEVIDIGYILQSIIEIHFYNAADFFKLKYSSLLLARYYTIDELFAGGYSKKDLNVDGNNINQYCLIKQCNKYLPSVLGSSFNQNRISKKASFAQSITTRSGGSYTTSYSSYTNSNPNPSTPVPPVCPDTFTLKTVTAGTACQSLNIPSKSSASFSNFIRNYIKQQVYLHNTGTIDKLNSITNIAINNIYILQQSNPDIPIYTTIQNYFNPSITIIL